MKKILSTILVCLPLMAAAQTVTNPQDKAAILKAEAEAKAEAAIKAAKAAQEAAEAAQKAAEEAAAAAQRMAEEQNAAAEEAKHKAEIKAKVEADQKAAIETETKRLNAQQEAEKTNAETPSTSWTAPVIIEEPEEASANKVPEEVKRENVNIYLEPNAIPEVNGKVTWVYELDVPGKSAKQIYDSMLKFMSKMTKESNQLERSKVALVNEKEHRIAATMQEWLVFASTFLSLDRTKFNYMLQAKCSDGHLQVILDRITYNYGEEDDVVSYKAEEWITDKYAVNKKRTRMYPVSGKFRRKTIDRKNEIFKNIKAAIL